MKNLVLARLQSLSKNSKLPHSWLFVAKDLHQALQTVEAFSAWLLCSNPQDDVACNACKQCQLFAAGTHPDFRCVTMQEDNNSIVIDDIRSANEYISSKPQLSRYKIVQLYPAEKMNLQASNAILKNLEEPGENTIIFLLSRHADMLLDTIVSRCQVVRFNVDAVLDAEDLEQIRLILSDLHDLWVTKSVTPLEITAIWVKRWPNEVLYWFELAIADLMVGIYTRDSALVKYSTLYKNQAALIESIDLNKLWLMLQKLQQGRNWFGNGHKPNLQLLIEDIVLT